MDPRHPMTTAIDVICECGHETTVLPFAVTPWASEVPDELAGGTSLAIADEDGLFTCAVCGRSVYVPTVSLN